MKQRGLFVIGTDTDAGKTFVTALLGGLMQPVTNVGLLKPIASGAKIDESGQLYSEDGRQLLRLSKLSLSLEDEINPIRIVGEYSPKIAAAKQGMTIDMDALVETIKDTVNKHDYTLIEGAGGVTTPFTDDYRLDDVIKACAYPTLLVADGRLGSINRVILTAHFVKSLGMDLIGIIVNDCNNTEPFLLKTNCEDMAHYTGLSILGVLPRYEGPQDVAKELAWAAQYLDVEKILQVWEDYYEK